MAVTSRVSFVRCAASMLALGVSMPALAQQAASTADTPSGNDIIVTAQRIEQRLQDVPISITVLSQETITRNNITSAKDIATFTPGLSTNNRYGGDSTTFTIRGFQQEQRTYATVGTYFADVIGLRGSGAQQGGDGAGPGNLFDLQNVQVLKGPQGTLFGRNVTGGAVLLVPRRPSGNFEGYFEGSYGNYDMKRAQGVVNVPISDSFRIRAGFDALDRDGYLKNIGRFGDGKYGNHGMGDANYYAIRVSAIADLTPNLENYTIVTYSRSHNNATIPKVLKAYPRAAADNVAYFGNASVLQMAREAQAGGFWTVSNRLPDSASASRTWQLINTTTWTASDAITVKNIFSYGELRATVNQDLFGNYVIAAGVTPGTETPGQVTGFAFTHSEPTFGRTNAESSAVEELQIQGHPGDGRFTWQAGLYAEMNDPIGFGGVQTSTFTGCDNITTFNCVPNSTGSFSVAKTKFRDYAAYAQASYKLAETLTVTGGIRYTYDKVSTELHNLTTLFAGTGAPRFRCSNVTAPGFVNLSSFPFTATDRFTACRQNLSRKTEAPTWLVGLDYKPTENILIYGKWSRGYRQGGLSIFGPDPIQPFDKETVDTYEVGTKTSWTGSIPGYFNISGYYNDFRDQQLQFGVSCVPALPGYTVPCSGNSAIINAGKSRLYGFETEIGVTPFQGLRLEAAYAYLKSKLQEAVGPAVGSLPPYNSFTPPLVGGAIVNSQPHKVTASANYTLPLPDTVGQVTFGGTFVYTGRYRSVTDAVTGSGNGILPGTKVYNLNANWNGVGGLPIDISAFATNITNKHTLVAAQDNQLRGFVSYYLGEPRMYGGRIRYRF